MRMNILIGRLLPILIVLFLSCSAAEELSYTVKKSELPSGVLSIGVSVKSDRIIWVSGTGATLFRSVDGGANWQTYQYEQVDSLQFRDVSAINADSAVVLSAGAGRASQILSFSTKSGWHKLFQMENENGFLDAIEHWPNHQALAYGDSFDSLLYVLKYSEKDLGWKRIAQLPSALPNEGGFASSGTNIATIASGKAIIGTGAAGTARLLQTSDYGKTWTIEDTPMLNGDFAGVTSVRLSEHYQLISGGDLGDTTKQSKKVYIRRNGQDSWEVLENFHSKGAYYGSDLLELENGYLIICCGPYGVDLYNSRTAKWHRISEDEYWSCSFIDESSAIFLGREGDLLTLTIDH